MPIRLSNQLAPREYGDELVSNVTSQTFGGYLLVSGTQQQLTTAKVSVGQSWKASRATPHLGRVGRASWHWGEV